MRLKACIGLPYLIRLGGSWPPVIVLLISLIISGCYPDKNRNILFSDDFSSTAYGWDRQNTPQEVTDYATQFYRIFIDKPNRYLWSNPSNQTFTDVRIEVDAVRSAGPDKNDMGIICRYIDGQNFYFFTIGNDGSYAIHKFKNGEESLIGIDHYLTDQKGNIHTGSSINHLQADCIGSTLTLYVNGAKLADAQDKEYQKGNVGLIAGTDDQPGVEIRFTHFQVLKP